MKILRLALCAVIVFTILMASIYCDSVADNNSNTYRISFTNGVKFDSKLMKDDLNAISNWVKQVRFTVETSDDVFTIGYRVGDDGFDYDRMTEDIELTLGDLNHYLESDEECKTNDSLTLQDLCLYDADIFLDDADAYTKTLDIISKLSGIDGIKQNGAITDE